MSMQKRICVFCASSAGARPAYTQAAQNLGGVLAEKKIPLVYGGGKVGLMGKLADSVLAAGGKVIGVIPRSLVRKEIAHSGLSDLRVVESMHERKALMAELADAFIALPGGFGTFEEFCEVLTWAQLGLHRKPFGILNVDGYYDHLLRMFDHAVGEQFLHPIHRALVVAEQNPVALVDFLLSHEVPQVEKWITPSTT
jgi:uncharacterized protein (TIGR00730 family)